MSLSTGSGRHLIEPLDAVTMTAAEGSVRPSSASLLLSVSEAHHRRRLTSPLLDFVSSLRNAIASFGQGQVRARQELTLRQIAEVMSLPGRSPERSRADATRILYIGDLSPHSGVVDLLACVIAWAERHPDTSVDICWAGKGDLQGVMRAQSTPPNLSQSFTVPADTNALATLAADRGILAVPPSGIADLLPVAQAMAIGLPVLGSKRCPEVHMLVTSSATGWLFDPLSAAEMAGALDAALSTPSGRLAEMHAAARRRLIALCDEWLGAEDESRSRQSSAQFTASGQV